MNHNGDSRAKRQPEAVAAGDSVATGRALHPARVQGRALAATILRTAREALVARGDHSATGRAIAGRWGVSHTAVDRYSDPASGVAVALGDVLAMPRALAVEVLTGALAALDEGGDVPTRDSLDRVAIELGVAIQAYHHDIADGREDEHQRHAAHLRKIAGIALRGAAASARRAGR